jgi:hypothetical protein
MIQAQKVVLIHTDNYDHQFSKIKKIKEENFEINKQENILPLLKHNLNYVFQ